MVRATEKTEFRIYQLSLLQVVDETGRKVRHDFREVLGHAVEAVDELDARSHVAVHE
jgi:hypothetical protein